MVPSFVTIAVNFLLIYVEEDSAVPDPRRSDVKVKMRTRGAIIITILLLACSTHAHADRRNEFYGNFVDLLRNDETSKLETLVRMNRDLAAKCLDVIRGKIQREENQQRVEAYSLVAQELEELIAVTSRARNCSAADKIYQRGLRVSVPEERLKAFSRVVRLCPSHEAAYCGLGEVNKNMGKFDDAVGSYEKALGIAKDSAGALLGLGETLLSAGLYQRSLPYFERALGIKPESARAKKFIELGGALIAKDQPGFITEPDIVVRLRTEQENLMCMCPQFSKLRARLRLHEVTFSASSFALSSGARRQLDELAGALKSEELKSGNYLIEGHSDNVGNKNYNQTLSQQRAQAVKQYLVEEKGVDPSAVAVAAAGDSRAWTTNDTLTGRRANRRIEILSVDASAP